MQAIILAAGPSSRFYPFSSMGHKSMVKIIGKPILQYTLEGLKKIGIKDIVLVVSPDSKIKDYFKDGKDFGLSLSYVVQKEPNGAGQGILLTKHLIKKDFLLLNASHVDIEKFAPLLIGAKTKDIDSLLVVQERPETWNYGVVKVEGLKIVDLVEKPKKGQEPSKFCVLGIYLFSKDFLRELENTPYEHYQLEKAISRYAKTKNIQALETNEKSVTLKFPWNLLPLKDFLFKEIKRSISSEAKVEQSAEIIGDVIIEEGAIISNGAKIKGPCFIGKNVFIGDNVVLRGGVDVEEQSVIGANMELKNTLIMEGSKTHSGFIGDSVIGANCRIGTQFCTANVRLDRGSVQCTVKGEPVDTGMKFFGTIIGNNVKIGVKSSTMPGVIIGNNAIIGPSTTVLKNVEEDTRYYSKFQEIVSKK